MTFREAYRNDREFLVRNLIVRWGRKELFQSCENLGAPARQAVGGGITMDPVAPLDLAQSYALMATLGNAGTINPGIRVPNWAPSGQMPQKKTCFREVGGYLHGQSPDEGFRICSDQGEPGR